MGLCRSGFIIANGLICILALTVAGCSIWLQVDQQTFAQVLQDVFQLTNLAVTQAIEDYLPFATTCIMSAMSVCLLSGLGCLGSANKKKCLLTTYIIFIVPLAVFLLIGTILAYTGSIESALKAPLLHSLNQYNDSASEEDPDHRAYMLKTAWNEVQAELRCCGVDGASDWRLENSTSTVLLPEGCCRWRRAGNDSLHSQDGVTELREDLAELTRELEEAVNAEDFQQAQQKKEAIAELEKQIREIKWEWVGIAEEQGGNDTDSVIMDCRSSSLPANESQFAFTGCYTKVVDQIELSRPFIAGLLAMLLPLMLCSCCVNNDDD